MFCRSLFSQEKFWSNYYFGQKPLWPFSVSFQSKIDVYLVSAFLFWSNIFHPKGKYWAKKFDLKQELRENIFDKSENLTETRFFQIKKMPKHFPCNK